METEAPAPAIRAEKVRDPGLPCEGWQVAEEDSRRPVGNGSSRGSMETGGGGGVGWLEAKTGGETLSLTWRNCFFGW